MVSSVPTDPSMVKIGSVWNSQYLGDTLRISSAVSSRNIKDVNKTVDGGRWEDIYGRNLLWLWLAHRIFDNVRRAEGPQRAVGTEET